MPALHRYGIVVTITYDLSDTPAAFRRKEKTLVTMAFETKDPELKKRIDFALRQSYVTTFLTNLHLQLRAAAPGISARGLSSHVFLERMDQV